MEINDAHLRMYDFAAIASNVKPGMSPDHVLECGSNPLTHISLDQGERILDLFQIDLLDLSIKDKNFIKKVRRVEELMQPTEYVRATVQGMKNLRGLAIYADATGIRSTVWVHRLSEDPVTLHAPTLFHEVGHILDWRFRLKPPVGAFLRLVEDEVKNLTSELGETVAHDFYEGFVHILGHLAACWYDHAFNTTFAHLVHDEIKAGALDENTGTFWNCPDFYAQNMMNEFSAVHAWGLPLDQADLENACLKSIYTCRPRLFEVCRILREENAALK